MNGRVKRASGNGTVLIIDDDPDMRDLYYDELMSMGFKHILEAENGKRGLEIYRGHADEIVLIILDMRMPVMDGAATFRALNHDPDRKAKVLISTTEVETPLVKALLEEGADKALSKFNLFEDFRPAVFELIGL